jgi:HD-like signal output (HDOD) protein
MGLFKGIPEDLMTMEMFWKHSIGCGLSARILATSQRESNLERFFVAGILHDIGRLVMFINIPDLYREMIEESRSGERLLYEVERERLGFDHGEVGGTLLQRWKIPARVAEPVGCHHCSLRAGQYPREASILHLADLVSHALELGSSGEECVPRLDQQAWEQLGLSPHLFPSLFREIDAQFAETVKILEVKGGDE